MNLKYETLFQQNYLDWVPQKNQVNNEAKTLFDSYTQKEKSKGVYSGYRDDVISAHKHSELFKKVQEWRARFNTLVVIGIGGSSLGVQSVIEALKW
jgi:glucose-6-phosphate isomerase